MNQKQFIPEKYMRQLLIELDDLRQQGKTRCEQSRYLLQRVQKLSKNSASI